MLFILIVEMKHVFRSRWQVDHLSMLVENKNASESLKRMMKGSLSLDRRSCESQRTNSRWERNSSRYGNHCDNHRSECIQSRSTENPIDKIVKRGKTDAEGNPHSFLCLTKHFRIIEVVVENLWCTENYLLSTWRYNDWPITAYGVLP